MMQALFDRFQELLREPRPDYVAFRIEYARESLPVDEQVRGRSLVRLSLALQDFAEGRAGTSDVAVLLRQVIRTYRRRLAVPQELWHLLRAREHMSGLRQVPGLQSDMVSLDAVDWEASWLAGAQAIDSLEPRRGHVDAIGDGVLYDMSGQLTYLSEAQKAAAHMFMFAADGSTTLATLPTGAGKSLVALQPAWRRTEGGQTHGSTTLVIVPTIALALDQRRAAQRYFPRPINDEFQPESWTSDTPAETRASVLRGLRAGSLPVLYLSPEALLSSALYDACLEAAANGTLDRLVVDEAHLVETWGAGFRTEFQLIATYRRKLLAASAGRLKTLLLSATVSERCDALLAHLFGDNGRIARIQANQLRPEIAYWFAEAPSPEQRQEWVLDALRHLPRPAILYVTTPDDAEQWLSLLRSEGFGRVAAFSGRTDADERRRLIHEWTSDRRDLMIGTSAFGVGVDKPDVRTIVHACLPENMSRFYQEVGRAGRDGWSATSLLCTAPGDADMAFGMTSSAVITTQRAFMRWEGMRQSRRVVKDLGDTWLVDTNAAPVDNPEIRPSPVNCEWNEHTLLMMQRADLIEVDEIRSDDPSEDEGADIGWLQIRIRRSEVINHPNLFIEELEQARTSERGAVNRALQSMSSLVQHFAIGSPTTCLAFELAELYPKTAIACGGCPACRVIGDEPYADRPALTVELFSSTPAASILTDQLGPGAHGVLKERLGARGALNVLWEGPRRLEAIEDLDDLLVNLVRSGIQQLILPKTLVRSEWAQAFVRRLQLHSAVAHLVVPEDWVKGLAPRPLFALPTVVVYPAEDLDADELHRALVQRGKLLASVPQVSIAHRSLYLPSEHGLFVERINGVMDSISSIAAALRASATQELF